MTGRSGQLSCLVVSGPFVNLPRHALILAGGEGRRLAPLTTVIPKPLVPVGDRSILEVLISQLANQGFTRITIALGHLGHLIRAVVGDGERFGTAVDYTHETTPLGTAGAVGLVPDLDVDGHLLLVNGDTLTDVSFSEIFDRHVALGAAATVAVHRRSIYVDFGVLTMDGSGALAEYIEKPTHSYLVSMGVNVLGPEALKRLVPSRRVDVPGLLHELQADNQLVMCHEAQCVWLDLGRVDDVRAAGELFDQDPTRFLPSA
jgi:NDP-mannose synthase